jgi:RimJ/RimL family protein N-acetyltransferase
MAPEFVTQRLSLRSWRDEDLEPFAALNGDPRVMEFYPSMLDRAESDASASRIREHLDHHDFGLWAVEVRSGAPFIGYVGLSTPAFTEHFTPCVEIGWRLAYEHWGRGYATEAARRVVRYAFEKLQLPEIVSFTAAWNLRSQQVMQRIGMCSSSSDSFEHPMLPELHPLRRHVLYRVSPATWSDRHCADADG